MYYVDNSKIASLKARLDQDRDGAMMDAQEDLLRYRKHVQSLLSQYVHKGQSVDDLLESLAEKWNPLFDTRAKENLVEDVNALVRDYIRPIRHSFYVRPPDSNRIHALAEQLSASKGLAKIKKKEALLRYIKLYIVKCLATINRGPAD